jgi:hypothetical protein
VTSYDPQNPVTLELYKTGTTENPAFTGTIPAQTSGSGQVTQGFTIGSVSAGTYDLKVSKTGHTDYWLTGIPVGSSDLAISTEISLLCGDVDGNGNINANDLATLTSTLNYNKPADQTKADHAQNAVCDVNGDGNVNANDVGILTSSTNYNGRETTVIYEGGK